VTAKLSVAMICRNEAPRIARCLKSIRQHVDEVVILDTGSTDATMELARHEGADVIASEPERTVDLGDGFQCLGNFAAARNRSIEIANGDWVLIVDADHVFVPPTFRAIRHAMQMDDLHAASLRYHTAKNQGARPANVVTGAKRLAQPFNSLALLRNTDAPHYYGIIHEVASMWCERQALRNGTRQVVLADSRIADYGHEPGIRKALDKDKRNRLLLERAIANDPDDPAPYTYLAGMYLQLGDIDRAAGLIADVYDKIGKDPRLAGTHLLRLCACMGLVAFNLGNATMTWMAARLWDDHDGRAHPDMDTVRGLACELMGRRDDATTYYRTALTRSADAVGCQHIPPETVRGRLKALAA